MTHFRRVPTDVTWCEYSGTRMVRLCIGRPNYSLRPVIQLHGFSASKTLAKTLSEQIASLDGIFALRMTDALVASGRVVYVPYTGANWGTNTTTPSNGGTGRAAIDAAIAMAGSDGFDTTTVDILGTSGGGLNALNWGWRNPTQLNKMFLLAPGIDMSYAYDQDATSIAWGLGSISASMRAIYGSADKPAWYASSADVDPVRNTASVEVIGDRIAIFSARDDEVVPWSTLVTFAETVGAQLTASNEEGAAGGGHLLQVSYPAWDDLLPLKHFT